MKSISLSKVFSSRWVAPPFRGAFRYLRKHPLDETNSEVIWRTRHKTVYRCALPLKFDGEEIVWKDYVNTRFWRFFLRYSFTAREFIGYRAAMELERTPMARDLDHLNEQVKAKLEELIDAPFTATERSSARRQMFEDEEREYLGRLPRQAFSPLDIRVFVVDRGHCVRISGDGHRYSTPPEYTDKRVSVTITDDKIYIYDLDSWVKIAEHKRYKNVQGNKTHLLTNT